jgi:hypothetical protein
MVLVVVQIETCPAGSPAKCGGVQSTSDVSPPPIGRRPDGAGRTRRSRRAAGITARSWRSGNPSQRNGRAAPLWQRREVGQGAWQPRSIGRPRLCDGARAQINVACRGWPDNDVGSRGPSSRVRFSRAAIAAQSRAAGKYLQRAHRSRNNASASSVKRIFPCRGDNSFAKMPSPLGAGWAGLRVSKTLRSPAVCRPRLHAHKDRLAPPRER